MWLWYDSGIDGRLGSWWKNTGEAAGASYKKHKPKIKRIGCFSHSFRSMSIFSHHQWSDISVFRFSHQKLTPSYSTNIPHPHSRQCQCKILMFPFDFFLFSFSFMVSRKTLKLKCLRNIISLSLSSFTSSVLGFYVIWDHLTLTRP